MDQLVAKALWCGVIGMTWWSLAGSALFASQKQREEQPSSLGLRIWMVLISVLTLVLLYVGVNVHWYPASDGTGTP